MASIYTDYLRLPIPQDGDIIDVKDITDGFRLIDAAMKEGVPIPRINEAGNWEVRGIDMGKPSRGYTPQKGKDYFTEEEIAEYRQMTLDATNEVAAEAKGVIVEFKNSKSAEIETLAEQVQTSITDNSSLVTQLKEIQTDVSDKSTDVTNKLGLINETKTAVDKAKTAVDSAKEAAETASSNANTKASEALESANAANTDRLAVEKIQASLQGVVDDATTATSAANEAKGVADQAAQRANAAAENAEQALAGNFSISNVSGLQGALDDRPTNEQLNTILKPFAKTSDLDGVGRFSGEKTGNPASANKGDTYIRSGTVNRSLYHYDGLTWTGYLLHPEATQSLDSTSTSLPLAAIAGKRLADRIGALSTLKTTAKTDLVAAINEVNAKPSTPVTDTPAADSSTAISAWWAQKAQEKIDKIGDLATLVTAEKGSVVGAINELKATFEQVMTELEAALAEI